MIGITLFWTDYLILPLIVFAWIGLMILVSGKF